MLKDDPQKHDKMSILLFVRLCPHIYCEEYKYDVSTQIYMDLIDYKCKGQT